jgi:hypothetical protein
VTVESAAELFGLPSAATFGKWRDDESVTLTKTPHVAVQSSRDVPLFLDGERVDVGRKAEISFVSDAVNMIVSKPNQGICCSLILSATSCSAASVFTDKSRCNIGPDGWRRRR